jgi:hypothetical protein
VLRESLIENGLKLIVQLLKENPSDRLSAEGVLNSDLFAKVEDPEESSTYSTPTQESVQTKKSYISPLKLLNYRKPAALPAKRRSKKRKIIDQTELEAAETLLERNPTYRSAEDEEQEEYSTPTKKDKKRKRNSSKKGKS